MLGSDPKTALSGVRPRRFRRPRGRQYPLPVLAIDASAYLAPYPERRVRRPVLLRQTEDTYGLEPTPAEAWLPIAFRAFARLAARRTIRDVLIVGTGNGLDALGAAEIFPLRSLTATDLFAASLAVSQENVLAHLVDDGAIDVLFHAGDLLAAVPADARFDLVYENLPNLPAPTGDRAGARHQHRAVLRPGAATVPEPFGQYLLALHHRCLLEARPHVRPGGGVLTALGGRMPHEVAFDLHRACGYRPELPAFDVKRQVEPGLVIPPYARAEEAGDAGFTFYAAEAIDVVTAARAAGLDGQEPGRRRRSRSDPARDHGARGRGPHQARRGRRPRRADDPRHADRITAARPAPEHVCNARRGHNGPWPPRQCWTQSRRPSRPSETRERSPMSRSPSERSPTGWKTSRCPARAAPGTGSRSSIHIAETSPALARLVEGHLDALAIMAELGTPAPAYARLGVWAAEPGQHVAAHRTSAGWRLEGVKPYASGANELTHALITARDGDDRLLFLVPSSGWTSRPGTWQAVGMAGSDSPTVDVAATLPDSALVGAPGSYLGAPRLLARRPRSRRRLARRRRRRRRGAAQAADARPLSPHAAAHLGGVEVALVAAESVLRDGARAIDDDPLDLAGVGQRRAMIARAAVERSATEVLDRVGRALGAGPLCHDRAHARRVADLTVYLRQSHAESDLEALGRMVAGD